MFRDSSLKIMLQHGKERTQTFRFGGGKFAVKTVYYCAKCDMEVDEFLWKGIHDRHILPSETTGAALEIPEPTEPKFTIAGAN